MNIAFPTAFLFLLVLPGIILIIAFSRGRWPGPGDERLILETPYSLGYLYKAGWCVFVSIVLHLLWYFVATSLGCHINIASAISLLVLPNDADQIETAIRSVSSDSIAISLYFASLYLFSWTAGLSLIRLIIYFRLDLKWKFLRVRNDWYYLLSGDILRFAWEDSGIEDEEEIQVYISTVVHHTQNDYLYIGILNDFWLDTSGNLDRIMLAPAWRRTLKNDRKYDTQHEAGSIDADERYYPIAGNNIIIRYSEMVTLNIEYLASKIKS